MSHGPETAVIVTSGGHTAAEVEADQVQFSRDAMKVVSDDRRDDAVPHKVPLSPI